MKSACTREIGKEKREESIYIIIVPPPSLPVTVPCTLTATFARVIRVSFCLAPVSFTFSLTSRFTFHACYPRSTQLILDEFPVWSSLVLALDA